MQSAFSAAPGRLRLEKAQLSSAGRGSTGAGNHAGTAPGDQGRGGRPLTAPGAPRCPPLTPPRLGQGGGDDDFAGEDISPGAAEPAASGPALPRSSQPHRPGSPPPPHPHGRQRQHLGAQRPRPGLWKEAVGAASPSPADGIYLAGELALPGPAPTSTALPAAAGDKGEGPPSGALALHPPPGQGAAATPLQLPQSLALEAAILAPAARPPSRRSRRQAWGNHGTRSADIPLPSTPLPRPRGPGARSRPSLFLPSPHPLPSPPLPGTRRDGTGRGGGRDEGVGWLRAHARGVQSPVRSPPPTRSLPRHLRLWEGGLGAGLSAAG